MKHVNIETRNKMSIPDSIELQFIIEIGELDIDGWIV